MTLDKKCYVQSLYCRVHYLLPSTTYRLPFDTTFSSITDHLIPTIDHLPSTTYHPLPIFYHLSSATYHRPSIIYCLSSTVFYHLFIRHRSPNFYHLTSITCPLDVNFYVPFSITSHPSYIIPFLPYLPFRRSPIVFFFSFLVSSFLLCVCCRRRRPWTWIENRCRYTFVMIV
jgi:hypothetical protein